MRRAGRSLLQLPGPTNVPDLVLRAIAQPTIDHRGVEFASIVRGVLRDLAPVFGTAAGAVALYPGSGTGGWEAALVNTLSLGDRVLTVETGFFAAGWAAMAGKLGLDVVTLGTDWRGPASPERIAEALACDAAIRAVQVVHNETSTGATTDVGAVRAAIDRVGHPALLLVDAVSSLGSMPVLHDEWRADVTVSASQKGLMLPPGLVMLAVSERAREARESAGLPRSYWDWDPMLAATGTGQFPFTPATNLVVGLRTALDMMAAEGGLGAVFARHARLADAVRCAVAAWGLEFVCTDVEARSNSITAVLLPAGVPDTAIRAGLLERFALTVGGGLGRLGDRCIRIGHLGDVDELMIVGALAGLEMGLPAWVPVRAGGVQAAMDSLGRAGGA